MVTNMVTFHSSFAPFPGGVSAPLESSHLVGPASIIFRERKSDVSGSHAWLITAALEASLPVTSPEAGLFASSRAGRTSCSIQADFESRRTRTSKCSSSATRLIPTYT